VVSAYKGTTFSACGYKNSDFFAQNEENKRKKVLILVM
jgi:hypothetical protein